MEKLLFVAFLLYILQMVLTYWQIKNYRKNLSQMAKKGLMGVGSKKKKLGAGKIVILVSDETGNLVEGKMMQGITVWARFKPMDSIQGVSITEFKEKMLQDEKKNAAILEAISQIENQLAKREETVEAI